MKIFWNAIWRLKILLAVFLLLAAAAGCDSVDSLDSLIGRGKALLGMTTKAAPAAAPSAETQAAADMELIGEMYRVIFMRDTLAATERDTVSRLAGTLAQGASLEGLYNGLTHSAEYRQLETEHRGAPPAALRAFTSMLAQFETDLPTPTAFDASAAEPLAAPVEPSFRSDFPEDRPSPAAKPAPGNATALATQYAATFATASFYTLKRVAGDEALKLVSARASSPEQLALWYSKWAVQTAGMGIDFGVSLRNRTDEDFHYRWARSMPVDRVKWEVLNRVHRILNHGAKS